MGGICSKPGDIGKRKINRMSSVVQIDPELVVHFRTKDALIKKFKNSGIEHIVAFDEKWAPSASLEDIQSIYDFDSAKIGEGHYGSVRKAWLKYDKSRIFAVKTLNKEKMSAEFHLLKRELEILRVVDHPNIIKFHECYQDEKYFHFVMEFCSGKVLIDEIIEKNRIDEGAAKRIFFQATLAVNHLHHRGICHRDVKPDNFIYSNPIPSGEIKLIDFGLSKQFNISSLKTVVGTPQYVSPEALLGEYDNRCDNWSLGVMLYVMLSGTMAFRGVDRQTIFKNILECNFSFDGPIWDTLSNECKDLIEGLLEPQLEKRLSLTDVLGGAWLQRVNVEWTTLGKNAISNDVIERLNKFNSGSSFQKEVLKLMVSILHQRPEVLQVKPLFFYIDYLYNGTINQKELHTFFKELNKPRSLEEIEKIINSLHLQQSTIVTYTEFIAATVTESFYSEEKNLELAFRRFDIDNTGFITPQNIEDCFSRFGYKISQNDIDRFVSDFDLENDGVVSKAEFFKIMTRELK